MKTIATLLTAVALLSAASHAADKPNVVLILIDDFGYECVTAAQKWPTVEVAVKGFSIQRPGVLER